MTTISVQRNVSGVLTSADSASISILNSSGVVVAGPTVTAPVSAGVYTYDASTLTPGTYTAVWTFEVSGMADQVVSRIFTAEGPVTLTTGVTLMDIERRVARRVGPYREYKATLGGDEDHLVVRRLRSTLDIGDLEDLYLLRRGVYWDGQQVEDFTEDDRVRIVASYDTETGSLIPDDSWTLAPQENERVELMALDPDQELRPAVIQGLERCYYWDIAQLAVTGALRELSLATVPWLRDTGQITSIETGRGQSLVPASSVHWWRAIRRGNALYLHSDWLAPGNLDIHALRPHSTYVNGELSLAGPNDDFDVLHVDLEYAARSGHVMCWVNYPDKLTPLAAQGLRLTATQAADAFTQSSLGVTQQRGEERVKIRWETDAVLSQIGNAAEVDD